MTPPQLPLLSSLRSAVREFSLSLRSDAALLGNTLMAFVVVPAFARGYIAGRLDRRAAAEVVFCLLFFSFAGLRRSHLIGLRHIWAYAVVFAAFSGLVCFRSLNPGADVAPCIGCTSIAFFLWQWCREDEQTRAALPE